MIRKQLTPLRTKWYRNNLYLWLALAAVHFLLDYTRYHYPGKVLLWLTGILITVIAFAIPINYASKMAEGKGSLPKFMLMAIVSIPVAIAIIALPYYGFSWYRDYQLEHDHTMATGKITRRFINNVKGTSYGIEFEFNAGGESIHSTKYLEKNEWDRYAGEQEVRLRYVPGLPLNNELLGTW